MNAHRTARPALGVDATHSCDTALSRQAVLDAMAAVRTGAPTHVLAVHEQERQGQRPVTAEGTIMTERDLFTTETAGLEQVSSPRVTRLRDGDRLDLTISSVRKTLGDAELRMLAYNGSIPGPTLRVDQGSEITVDTHNDGDVETTVHWHGLRLENRYDGVPHETQEPIPVGGSYTLPRAVP